MPGSCQKACCCQGGVRGNCDTSLPQVHNVCLHLCCVSAAKLACPRARQLCKCVCSIVPFGKILGRTLPITVGLLTKSNKEADKNIGTFDRMPTIMLTRRSRTPLLNFKQRFQSSVGFLVSAAWIFGRCKKAYVTGQRLVHCQLACPICHCHILCAAVFRFVVFRLWIPASLWCIETRVAKSRRSRHESRGVLSSSDFGLAWREAFVGLVRRQVPRLMVPERCKGNVSGCLQCLKAER